MRSANTDLPTEVLTGDVLDFIIKDFIKSKTKSTRSTESVDGSDLDIEEDMTYHHKINYSAAELRHIYVTEPDIVDSMFAGNFDLFKSDGLYLDATIHNLDIKKIIIH